MRNLTYEQVKEMTEVKRDRKSFTSYSAVEKYFDNQILQRIDEIKTRIKLGKNVSEAQKIWVEEKEFELKEKERLRSEAEKEKLEAENKRRKLKEEEARLKAKEEKEKKLRKLEAINNLVKVFNSDYIESRQYWESNLSSFISEEEFIGRARHFVINWYQEQGMKEVDDEQAVCIAEVWNDIQVTARAGSGKTATTVNKAYFLIKHCRIQPSAILLLAFNRQAAEEINKRLKSLLGDNAPQAMTFHALSYGIVHPEENIIFDDEESGLNKSKTVQQVIDSYIHDRKKSKKIEALMLKYFRADWDEIVKGGYHLKPEELVQYRRSIPKLGIDGKYYKSMGEKRIADYLFEHDVPYTYEKNFFWNGINYRPDFTISLNIKGLKGIIIEYLGMTGDREYDAETIIKKAFWNQKSDYIFIDLYPEQVNSTEKIISILETTLKQNGFTTKRLTEIEIWHRIEDRAIDEFSMIVSQFIGLCRKKMISPDDLERLVNKQFHSLSRLDVDFLRIVWEIYRDYVKALEMNGEEDFDGLLIRAEKCIDAGYSCWNRKFGSGDLKYIEYLFIDEYQDFTLLFYQLVKAIKNINSNVKLFCVGDDWQAINGFAGSDLIYFKDFKFHFLDSKTLTLSTNYRSAQDIVAIGNTLMYDEGIPAKAYSNKEGEVFTVDIDSFQPDDFEGRFYNNDIITPALIRLVYSYVKKGQRVALLCRRKKALPWHTKHDFTRGDFHFNFISEIRESLPKELRKMVVAMDTAHSYKGKEEDAIIVVDALIRSYPLIHPSNIFFRVLGRTIDQVIDEEKRLFYVALSRAKSSLIIITENTKESPFLVEYIKKTTYMKIINLNKLSRPKREGNQYIVSIGNYSTFKNGTFEIKSYLKENKYKWNSAKMVWTKNYSASKFRIDKLLTESWANNAINIKVSISDEFNNIIYVIDFKDGMRTVKNFGKTS